MRLLSAPARAAGLAPPSPTATPMLTTGRRRCQSSQTRRCALLAGWLCSLICRSQECPLHWWALQALQRGCWLAGGQVFGPFAIICTPLLSLYSLLPLPYPPQVEELLGADTSGPDALVGVDAGVEERLATAIGQFEFPLDPFQASPS